MLGSTARLNAACLVVVLSHPDIALTQAPFTLEFNPGAGMSVRLIIESQGEMVLVGVPDLPDSSVVHMFSLGSINRRATPIGGGNFDLNVRYDSLRTRYRLSGGRWREGQLASDSAVEATLTADRYMRLSELTCAEDLASVDRMRNGTGAPHFVLPADPVDVGGPWRSEITLPFAAQIPGDSAALVRVTLTGPAVGILDSLVVRGADTLAYLSVRGQFLPTTVTSTLELGGGPATAELWGVFVGNLIWSTGWSAFVSVVLTARVNQRFEAVMGSGVEDARITAIVTTRVRVRP